MISRLASLVAVEWQVQWRYGVPVALAGLAAVWAAAVALAGVGAAAPYVLFVEVMTVGTLIVGALTVLEHSTGVAAALRVTPATPVERVAARLGWVTVLTTLGAVPVLLAAGTPPARFSVALAAVALGALLLAAIGSAVASRTGTLLGFLSRVPWPLVPLLALPLAVGVGLLDGVGWYAVPTTAVMTLLLGSATKPAWALLTYLAVWCVAAVWLAARDRPTRERRRGTAGARAPSARFGFVHADLRNVTRDSVLVPIAVSPLLLGLAARLGYPPVRSWLAATHGVGLDPYQPVIALLTIVLHVPLIFGMVGALLVLDDIDDGVLRVVRVSPLGVRRYLGYRLATVTAATAAGLAVAVPLSGLVPASAWPAAVLAVPAGPLFTLAVLATASGRVGGVTASKLLGLLVHAPLATWWLTGPVGWLLAFWVVRGYADADPLPWLAGGVFVSGCWLVNAGPPRG